MSLDNTLMVKQLHLPTLGHRPAKTDALENACQRELFACLNTLKELRDNKNVDPAVRRNCANDILDRGFGRPATTSIIKSEPVDKGSVIDGQLADAQDHTKAVEEIAEWSDKPIAYWPEHVRIAAGLELGIEDYGAGSEGVQVIAP